MGLLTSLFGIGRLPGAMRPIVEDETIELLDEGVSGAIVLRRYRAPGRYHGYRWSGFLGSIVLTGARFAVFRFSRPAVNVSRDPELLEQLDLRIPEEGRLVIRFSADAFDPDASGEVEIRLKTPLARKFRRALRSPQD